MNSLPRRLTSVLSVGVDGRGALRNQRHKQHCDEGDHDAQDTGTLWLSSFGWRRWGCGRVCCCILQNKTHTYKSLLDYKAHTRSRLSTLQNTNVHIFPHYKTHTFMFFLNYKTHTLMSFYNTKHTRSHLSTLVGQMDTLFRCSKE